MSNRSTMPENRQDARFDLPIYLFCEGTNCRAFDLLGAHPATQGGRSGWEFVLWAPGAEACSVVGDFNGWAPQGIPMLRFHGDFWYAFASDLHEFDLYKYAVTGRNGQVIYKADPFAFFTEPAPGTASRLYDPSGFPWQDEAWLEHRAKCQPKTSPVNIYELHLPSFKPNPDGSPCSYTALAGELIPYVKSMGYTHISLLPLTTRATDDLWGYRVNGFFAPCAQSGTPKELMAFINDCHRAGLGVLMDWMGAGFAEGESGLGDFDGGSLYEYPDKHPLFLANQGVRAFDLSKNEVHSFLRSSLLYWVEYYHLDGVRLVAAEYLKTHAEDAYYPLRMLNQTVKNAYPAVITVADGPSGWRGVTTEVEAGGLGFDLVWDLGFVDNTLRYLALDQPARTEQHDNLTFPMAYAFAEHFLLPFSHDLVAAGNPSLIERMAGSYGEKFQNLRLLFAYLMAQPGKKLSFMGNEFAQFNAWSPPRALELFLLDHPAHSAFHTFMRDLHFFYLEHAALWQNDNNWEGYQWISPDDRTNRVVAFRRIADTQEEVIAIFHFGDEVCTDYSLGVPYSGVYTEVFSSDSTPYGGSGFRNPPITAINYPMHSHAYSIRLTLPPLSALFLEVKRVPEDDELSKIQETEVSLS